MPVSGRVWRLVGANPGVFPGTQIQRAYDNIGRKPTVGDVLYNDWLSQRLQEGMDKLQGGKIERVDPSGTG